MVRRKKFETSETEIGNLDYSDEKARLARLQADKVEIELAVLRGKLVKVQDVERAWVNLVGAFRAQILALPTRLAPELSHMTDARKIASFLTERMHEALNELAQYGVLTSQDDGDEGGGNSRTTSQTHRL